jgi:hypothetical protein
MRKISLNLDQETPFSLKHGLMRTSEFSRQIGSPFKKPNKPILKPKESYPNSRDFSGLSPIKMAPKESDSSLKSIFPLNKLSFNTNYSKFDSNEKIVNPTTKAEKPKYSLNSFSMKSSNESMFLTKDKENQEPNKFLKYQKNFPNQIQKVNFEEQKENIYPNENRVLKQKVPQNNIVSNKLLADHANICEYVEDFENSYNLQIQMLNREYKSQHLLIAILLIFWIYFMKSIAIGLKYCFDEPLNNEEEENDYFSLGFSYFKYAILLALIIYSRISSFESKLEENIIKC